MTTQKNRRETVKQIKGRRAMLAGLGAVATAGALGVRAAQAQAVSVSVPFAPTLHIEDAWMSGIGGRHRIVLDVTTPEGVPDGIRFAGNLFTAHKTGYGVDEADVAIILCLRHGATGYGYGDAIWSKYGKTIEAKTTPPPTANPFNSGSRTQLTELAKRGVQFMVCGTASRGLAGRIAGPGGDADAVLKEMRADLIPSARIVAAGVVGVVHAQERGFSLVYVG
jgi:intracellular sulfur oxidation DsrE/DsrF family protein